MQKVTTVKQLVEAVKLWRRKGDVVAFVPTMGNLHAGHIKLVTEARKKADKVVVSIFVNPTQFGPGEDYESYPRTENQDEAKLSAADIDLLFLPAVNEIYPKSISTTVSVKDMSAIHCGADRPGHFDGVATVVTKLFNIVRPDMAFFGEKDFQQLVLIKTLVQDLNIQLEIFGVATERESDGLAMSSRNGFLTGEQRLIAPFLYQALCKAKDDIQAQQLSLKVIEKQSQESLGKLGFNVDYFSICRISDLKLATETDRKLVILTAAKLGKPRLIDNLSCSR